MIQDLQLIRNNLKQQYVPLFKFSNFGKIKSINETFSLRMIQSSFLFANITILEGKIIKPCRTNIKKPFALQEDECAHAGNLKYGVRLQVNVGDTQTKTVFQCVSALL